MVELGDAKITIEYKDGTKFVGDATVVNLTMSFNEIDVTGLGDSFIEFAAGTRRTEMTAVFKTFECETLNIKDHEKAVDRLSRKLDG